LYASFFHLAAMPFENTPDPRFFFTTAEHEEALAALRYGVTQRRGITLVTGAPGSGKTLLGRLLMENLGDQAQAAAIVHTPQDPQDLLTSLCRELGVRCRASHSTGELVARLEAFLLERHDERVICVAIVDEAQNLSVELLEHLRMLANLEVDEAKLLQVVLLAQPELTETLRTGRLDQFRQRIFCARELGPLARDQTRNYLRHRLKVAGAGDLELFNDEAVDLIHDQARGLPRMINQIADNALLVAFGAGRPRVDRQTVAESLDQMMRVQVASAPSAPTALPAPVAHQTAGVGVPAAGTTADTAVPQALTVGVLSACQAAVREAEDRARNLRELDRDAGRRLGELSQAASGADTTAHRLEAVRQDAETAVRQICTRSAELTALLERSATSITELQATLSQFHSEQAAGEQAWADSRRAAVEQFREETAAAGDAAEKLNDACQRALTARGEVQDRIEAAAAQVRELAERSTRLQQATQQAEELGERIDQAAEQADAAAHRAERTATHAEQAATQAEQAVPQVGQAIERADLAAQHLARCAAEAQAAARRTEEHESSLRTACGQAQEAEARLLEQAGKLTQQTAEADRHGRELREALHETTAAREACQEAARLVKDRCRNAQRQAAQLHEAAQEAGERVQHLETAAQQAAAAQQRWAAGSAQLLEHVAQLDVRLEGAGQWLERMETAQRKSEARTERLSELCQQASSGERDLNTVLERLERQVVAADARQETLAEQVRQGVQGTRDLHALLSRMEQATRQGASVQTALESRLDDAERRAERLEHAQTEAEAGARAVDAAAATARPVADQLVRFQEQLGAEQQALNDSLTRADALRSDLARRQETLTEVVGQGQSALSATRELAATVSAERARVEALMEHVKRVSTWLADAGETILRQAERAILRTEEARQMLLATVQEADEWRARARAQVRSSTQQSAASALEAAELPQLAQVLRRIAGDEVSLSTPEDIRAPDSSHAQEPV